MRSSFTLRTSFRVVHRDHRSSPTCLENVSRSARVAASAPDLHTHDRFERIEDGWRALAETQDWLDGVAAPLAKARATTVASKREDNDG